MSTFDRVHITTRNVAQTRRLGKRLATLLNAGDVVLLQGGLGMGKTALAQGVGVGLGVEVPVTSPTFVLLAQYETAVKDGHLPLFHADLYRLGDATEVMELALAEQAAEAQPPGCCTLGAKGLPRMPSPGEATYPTSLSPKSQCGVQQHNTDTMVH